MAKWSKIIQFSILLASIACSDNIFSKQNQDYAQSKSVAQPGVVAKHDPQKWFQKMIKKYPQAGLEKVNFIAGQSWALGHSTDGKMYILCPEDTYSGHKPFTLADEHSLLHEAGHVRNHSMTNIFFKDEASQECFIATLIGAYLYAIITSSKIKTMCDLKDNDLNILPTIKVSLLALVVPVIYTCIPNLLSRFDEMLADDFANKHSDVQILKAAYKEHMKHAQWQKKIYKNWIERWIHDFAHPASYDRAQAIAKVLWSKYGEQISSF